MRLRHLAASMMAAALLPTTALANGSGAGSGGVSFTNPPLLRPDGGSEPEV